MFYLRAIVVIAICSFGGIVIAQEAAPAEETSSDDNPYLSLRRSKNRATQLAAERYLNLVKLQEWSDHTGKFKTMGKYVAHDPNLQWVRLEVSRGSGKSRVTKEVQVPVAKLSTACQFRVRQISRLQPKLDELAASEAKEAEEDEQDDGRAMADERGDERQFEAYGAELERDPRAPDRGRESIDSGREAPPAPSGEWRTSYDAFRQNITLAMGADGQPQVEWGALSELRTLSEALATPASEASTERDPNGRQRMITEATAQLGEVTWEAPFAGMSSGLLGIKANLQLAPLSPPATIQFLIADQANLSRWAQLQPGQPVRFTGRLGMLTPHSIVVWVKMTDEQAAALAPAETERAVPERPVPEQYDPRQIPERVPRR